MSCLQGFWGGVGARPFRLHRLAMLTSVSSECSVERGMLCKHFATSPHGVGARCRIFDSGLLNLSVLPDLLPPSSLASPVAAAPLSPMPSSNRLYHPPRLTDAP